MVVDARPGIVCGNIDSELIFGNGIFYSDAYAILLYEVVQ